MTFSNDKPIYLQMADRLADEILAGTYAEGARIPSVREYAALLQVNINTAMKCFDELAREEIVYNQRGLGYFVSKGAVRRITRQRRNAFLKQRLPELFRQMSLLGIGIESIDEAWDTWQKENETTSQTTLS